MISEYQANKIRTLIEDDLFSTYPFLNLLCIKKIKPENKFVLIAGVSKIRYTSKNSPFIYKIKNNKKQFPSIIEIPEQLISKNSNRPKNLLKKLLKRNHLNLKTLSIPIIQKQRDVAKNQTKIRPLKSGINIGNQEYNVEGSLGAICKLQGEKGLFILSNWHTIVGVNGEINNPIIQPSAKNDGKSKTDKIANLSWYRLDKYMDVALAKLYKDVKVEKNLKAYTSMIKPQLNMEAIKIGGVIKKGKIIATNCTVKVYGEYPKGYIILKNQVISSKISSPGNSGSLVINNNDKVIGIIVGGDNKQYSVINQLHFNRPQNTSSTNRYCNNSTLKHIEIETFK